MELFVINRYNEDEDQSQINDRETQNLIKLKQRIEERKKQNLKRKRILISETEIAIKQESTEVINTVDPRENINDNDQNASHNYIKKDEIEDNKDEINTQEFKILGINEFEKKIKVKRVLPNWLSHPISVSSSLKNLSTKIEQHDWLHPKIKHLLECESIKYLFPVQEIVIPFIINAHKKPSIFWPNDVCVSVATGSGKTLAFVIPIVQVLMNSIGRHVQALVVLPVQELATQVAEVFKKYTAGTELKVMLLSGSVQLSKEQQKLVRWTQSNGWTSEVDIVICTAGRLVEHLHNTNGFSLKHLKFLVIDEADRIMDHIQNDWLTHLDRHIKADSDAQGGKVSALSWNNLTRHLKPPHKLLFSATLSQDPEKLEQWDLFQPKLFTSYNNTDDDDDDIIGKYVTPDELNEECIVSKPEEKPLILYHLLTVKKWFRVLCFTNSSQSAHRLSLLLNLMSKGMIKVAEISAALDRKRRETVFKKFTIGDINLLISTDALARGIDVVDCDCVISYDPPKHIKTYIHRVGRTGRAGKEGTAVTMLLENQVKVFKDLLKASGKKELPVIDIPESIYEDLSILYEESLKMTEQQIKNESDNLVHKSKTLKRGFRNIKRK